MIKDVKSAVDWEYFLMRHDPVWEWLPRDWMEGAFLGNGLLGTMVYVEDAGNGVEGLRFDIGRSDVTDAGDPNHASDGESRIAKRVPIGRFVLMPVGKIEKGTIRLDLWNAEARGALQTSCGVITWRSLVHATEEIVVVEIETADDEVEAGIDLRMEDLCQYGYPPSVFEADRGMPADNAPQQFLSVDPNASWSAKTPGGDWAANTCPPQMYPHENLGESVVQAHRDGSETIVAWRVVSVSEHVRRLYFTVGNSPEKRRQAYDDQRKISAGKEAAEYLSRALATPFDRMLAEHRTWWHTYYRQSFLSVPDPRIEGYYWIQIYKMGSATRANKPAIDLLAGPWSTASPYSSFVWDLNVQLTYWAHLTSNHVDLGESLLRMLERSTTGSEIFTQESAGVSTTSYTWDGTGEPANLVWACHNVYLQYRYIMDEDLVRGRLYPLLKLAFTGLFRKLEESPDGKLHLPHGLSPEYRGEQPNYDTNYELALFRWGCLTLVRICDQCKIDEPNRAQWEEALKKLADFPVDRNGYRIGAANPLTKGHRHYSHLLMVYPLYLVDCDQTDNRELIRQSLDHWLALPADHKGRTGYTYTGAASMYASIGDGQSAVVYLNTFLDGITRSKWPIVYPNTMYREIGPCSETPLSFARSVQDMLLQSWGGCIRVFPAVPRSWQDVAIDNLRTEGAFLVSAVRKNGRTLFIRLSSLAGERCLLRTDMQRPIRIDCDRPIELVEHDNGVLEVPLKKGKSVVLYCDAVGTDDCVSPVQGDEGNYNYYGLNRRFVKKM